jgi:CheY-like chemotaxis protein
MIVPTLTMFGLVRECTREVSKVPLATGAVVTGVIMASGQGRHDLGCSPRAATVIFPRSGPGRRRGDRRPPADRLDPVTEAVPATVVVYSHRSDVRDAIRTAVGRRPAGDVGPLTYVECTTGGEVIEVVDRGGIDLCILDGEAQPMGGLAVSRQLKEEIADPPALCVLIARQPDRWLAHWSLADGTLPFPIDPLTAPGVVADLLREHAARPPVARRSSR